MINLLPRAYRGLPREAYVLFFARMVNSLGNFVRPLLTLLLTDRLGMSQAQAGFFVTLASLTYMPGALLSGRLADHFGRKKVFFWSWVLAVVTLVPCAFLGVSPAVVWLLILNAFFSGAGWPVLTAMVTDLTNRENRARVFSLLYLGNNVGFAIGPALAGLLYRRHLPWVYLGDGATTLLALLLVGLFVKETLPDREAIGESQEGSPGETAEEGGTLHALLRRPAVIVFSVALIFYNFVYVQHAFSLPLQMRQSFGADGPRLFGFMMSVNALTVVALTSLVTRITARFSDITNTGLGGVMYAVGFGMILFLRQVPGFVVSTVVWTIGEILVVTNSKAYISNHTPITHRGRFAAVTDIISGAGFSLGPLLMGQLIVRTGLSLVWGLSFGLALVGTLLLAGLDAVTRKTRGASPLPINPRRHFLARLQESGRVGSIILKGF
ncbi:MAG: MFS transporter [Methanocella sp.]